MDIKEAQKQSYQIIEDWCKKNNRKHNSETVFLHLVEEVGELSREINHKKSNWRQDFDKKRLEEELADVLDKVFILAIDYGVDLEQAFSDKIKKLRKRFKLDK
jgi:NTP pyrophosphatase (non-canonical NTP hydrolase)